MIAIDTRVAGDTVRVTGAEVMPPIAAVMPLVPADMEVASPFEPATLLSVATEVVADDQLTEAVKSWVEWSL